MSVLKPENIKITLLSPLSIGDGNVLSPLADYLLQDGMLHRISEEKLGQYLVDNDLMTAYIRAVRQSADIAKDDFWSETMGVDDPVSICNGKKYQFYAQDNPTEVKTIARNGQHPFIAGSSVKGALKTALLYEWLTKDQSKELKPVQRALENYANNPGAKRESDKEIDRHINRLLVPKQPEDAKPAPPDFHHLRVADSSLVSDEQTIIILTKRLHLTKGTFDIPVAREAISALNTTCTLPITLYKQFQHSGLQNLNKEGVKGLFKSVNLFSGDHLDWVLHEVKQSKREIKENISSAKYLALENWLSELYQDIRNAPDNVCYLQLGAGKTYFGNSMGLSVYDAGDEAWRNWRNLFGLGMGKFRQKYFPETIVLETEQFRPCGWIKMQL